MNLSKANIKGDILGGVVSALVALPLSLACGILLFKNISGFEQLGINAAIYSAIIASLISAFIGTHSLQLSGPRVAMTLLLSDFLFLIYSDIKNLSSINIENTILVYLILCVVLSGFFQVIFSLLKFGRLIKFFPLSVTIGVSSTIGLIIVFKQFSFLFHLNQENFVLSTEFILLFIIVLFTIFLLFLSNIISNKQKIIDKIGFNIFVYIPLLAPALSIVLFFALFKHDTQGYLLENINIVLPSFEVYTKGFSDSIFLLKDYWDSLLITSFSIALLSSLSSLLSVSFLENKMPSKTKDTSIELKGQALGNILSGLFMGMPSAGSEARGLSNYSAGGRTAFSVVIHSLTLFVLIVFFSKYLAFIPKVALVAVLIHVGLMMTYPLYVLAKNMCLSCINKNKEEFDSCIKDILQTFLVVFIMLGTAIVQSLSLAIIFGFAAASLLFIYEMMKNTNFKVVSCNIHHSRRVRNAQKMDYLRKNASCIKIIELDGAIFFGTAESLRSQVEKIKDHSSYIILDFRKVTEIDITGAEIIRLSIKENKHISFSFSHIEKSDDTYQAFCSVGLIGPNGYKWYENSDLALEAVENSFLKKVFNVIEKEEKALSLKQIDLTDTLNKEELVYLEQRLKEKSYKKNDSLFVQNDLSKELFLLRKGSVSIKINGIRRISFNAGVMIGEMAFFENTPHFVDAICDEDVEVYILSKTLLNKIVEEKPFLVQKLMFEACKHLSKRLREVTKEVEILER